MYHKGKEEDNWFVIVRLLGLINLESLSSASERLINTRGKTCTEAQLLQYNCSVAENRLLWYIRDNTQRVVCLSTVV